MHQRPQSLAIDENTNPLSLDAGRDPIKPISLHPTKANIKKTSNTDGANLGVRTALSSIMNKMKNLRKKPDEEKRESKKESEEAITNTQTDVSTSISESLKTSSSVISDDTEAESKHATPQKKQTETLTSPGIDRADTNDPQHCVEYVKDIHSHYKKIENKYRADPNYIERQTSIKHKHRYTLVNWMVEMHQSFQLSNATLFLAVNLVDRFLSSQDVALKNLQLLASAAMFVASKYEDLQYPLSSEIVEIASFAFSKDELLKMERILLKVLDFNITVATVYPFLKRYLKCARCDFNQLALAYYLAELSLLEEASLHYLPSQIASACIYIAGKLCQKKNCWDDVMQYYTGYTEKDIEPCANVIVKITKKYNTSSIITCSRTKYSKEEKAKVANIVMAHFNKSQSRPSLTKEQK